MKIHEAMTAVMKSIGAVGKDSYNEHQRFNFRGIDDLHNACYGPLCEHGVVVLPEVLEARYDVVKTSTGKPARQATLRVRYTFVGPEGDQLSVTTQGEAMDSADKATSKALAMALKYALLQTFVLPTVGQDDADHDTPERAASAYVLPEAKEASLKALHAQIPVDVDDYPVLADVLAYAAKKPANTDAAEKALLEKIPNKPDPASEAPF